MSTYLVHIISDSLDRLRQLDEYELDLKHRAARKLSDDLYMVPGLLNDEEIERVQQTGYEVRIIFDQTNVPSERIQEVSKINRFADITGIRDWEARTVLGYLTTAEITSALQNLATLNTDLVTLIALPELTWEGRQSYAIRLRAGTATNRIGFLATGSMHAREWGGTDICLEFVNKMITAYRNNTNLVYGAKIYTPAQVRTIMEQMDLFIFPNVNPDGKIYSQTFDPASGNSQSFWWRKNRNPNTGTGSTAKGVDINRNFDFIWSSGIGTSAAPSSATYKGTAAFSEPEAKNVRYLMETYTNICYYIDIHSFGGLILYSWGDDNNQRQVLNQNFLNPSFNAVRGIPGDTAYKEFISWTDEETAKSLAVRMNLALNAVRGTSYTVQQAVGLYPTSGTSDDYAFSRHITNGLKRKIYSYTIEFGGEFVPPYAEMRNIMNEIGAALTECCWAVNSNIMLRDNSSDTGSVPVTGPFWNSPDIWVRNANDGGTVHQDAIRGRDNFLYLRVNNTGHAEAKQIKVRVLVANFAGTEFVYPNDWIPLNPSGGMSITSLGTYLIGESVITSIAPGASVVTSIRWKKELIPSASNWHPCLLAEAVPNDGLLPVGRHVWRQNNLAQKNITIVNAVRGQLLEFAFVAGNKFSNQIPWQLEIKKKSAPLNAELYLQFKSELQEGMSEMDFSDLTNVFKPLKTGTLASSITLLKKTSVAIPFPNDQLRDEQDVLVLNLPARVKIEKKKTGAVALSPSFGSIVAEGFTETELYGKKLLRLVNPVSGKINLPMEIGQMKQMQLQIAIPVNASIGDVYEWDVIQYNEKKQPVGGLTLQVHVAK